MAYTTFEEIQSDFKDLEFLSGSGNVTQEDVTQFVVEADSLINAYVGARYVVPVSTGDGVNLLKLFSRSLVTARIKKILEVKQEKSTDANQNSVGVLLSPSMVMKMLSDVRDDKINLDGAVSLLTGNGFYSNNVANDIAPVFEKDSKQW